MSRLGVSIYPEKASFEDNKNYLDLVSSLGFKRVFTCLLSAQGNAKEIKEEYRKIISHANSLGMEVIIDVAPNVFDKFAISYNDLSFFNDLGASGIRLDEGFDGEKEAFMTYNPYGLKIEFNASIYNDYIDNILSHKANRDKVIACHNFYPQKYTGLSLDLFKKCNQKLKNLGIKVAAFVSSRSDNTFGPWDISEGLCTLEMHRDLPLDLQIRHLIALGIDDVIIANAFAPWEELLKLKDLNDGRLALKIKEDTLLSDTERAIVYDYPHFVRPDMSDYMARSTFSRIDYKDYEIKANNTVDLKRGDVVILNENYGRYKGELHIILKDMKNEGNKNKVGHILEEELFMLEFIEPFVKFRFIKE